MPLPPCLILVPGGTVLVGCESGLPDERPVRRVHVEAFLMAQRPVSNADWDAFTHATGRPRPPRRDVAGFDAPDLPVVAVSWHDATAYCDWLAAATGLPLRLPTEAEREAAARGGLEAATWPWGDDPPQARPACRRLLGLRGPHVPGAGCENGFGLACLGDNVHEWCADWYDAGRPGRPARRASRGGSWRHAVPFSRVSARSSLPPDRRYDDYGFRLASKPA